ncbi:MAG: tRNA epoxyqueuosine(34) reductase QueG [Actinobacteria bacterium]|nr:MAG: tRNA epoxyqueuosine(34) reductase QueG [Actinomycetota bacterium]
MTRDDLGELAGEVRATGLAAGLDAVGIASAEPFEEARSAIEARRTAGLHGGMQFTFRNPARATDPGRSVRGAASLVVGARSYRRRRPDRPPGPMGEVARYSWQDHYVPLRDALDQVAAVLARAGWRVRVLVDDNALVDRAAAVRAGLGFFGKNTNVLLVGRGSWFVLGSVVTDAPLPVDEPVDTPEHGGCGTCTRCMPACPTGALVAPGVLDARRCLAWLLEAPGSFPEELRTSLGGRVYGCDDCQTVCPPNRAEDRRRPPPRADPQDEAWVDLLGMLDASDDELLTRFARWYVPRRDPRYLRRNALVALGNVADGDDPSVVRTLARWCGDADPLLREHAEWAARRLGRADLVGGRGR